MFLHDRLNISSIKFIVSFPKKILNVYKYISPLFYLVYHLFAFVGRKSIMVIQTNFSFLCQQTVLFLFSIQDIRFYTVTYEIQSKEQTSLCILLISVTLLPITGYLISFSEQKIILSFLPNKRTIHLCGSLLFVYLFTFSLLFAYYLITALLTALCCRIVVCIIKQKKVTF